MCKAREFASSSGCYKVILDCLENIVRFYEKCGFRKYGISMRHDL